MTREVTIIHNEAEYDAALAEYERLLDGEAGLSAAEGDRLQLLGMVIARYEDEVAPIPDAHPVDVIRFVMESTGRTQADLAELLGSRPRASEVLSGRRDLSLDQIRRLARAWHIPADALIGKMAAA